MNTKELDALKNVGKALMNMGIKRVYLEKPLYMLFDTGTPADVKPAENTDISTLIKQEKIKVEDCRACQLYKERNHTVYGDGDLYAKLMFIGEAPGAEEDRTGLPFVGRAGKLLDRILKEVGLSRSEVYICNTLKCRPPGNRDPLPEESIGCAPFLKRQISLINPRIIVTLGLPAIRYFIPGNDAMGKLRDKTLTYDNRSIIPTYHPAAALRFPAYKEYIFEDIKKARDILIRERLL